MAFCLGAYTGEKTGEERGGALEQRGGALWERGGALEERAGEGSRGGGGVGEEGKRPGLHIS